MPMQARVGDLALFMKKASMEVKCEGTEYLIVSHSSILILIRDDQISSMLDEIDGMDGV
jgi:co-chaperonin GroES (HSP10)